MVPSRWLDDESSGVESYSKVAVSRHDSTQISSILRTLSYCSNSQGAWYLVSRPRFFGSTMFVAHVVLITTGGLYVQKRTTRVLWLKCPPADLRTFSALVRLFI